MHAQEEPQMVELLRRIPLFADAGDAVLTQLAEQAVLTRYRAQQILFGEGDPARCVFFLQQGRVKLSRATPDGREHTLDILKDGDPIGLVAGFDQCPYPVTAEVWVPSQIILLQHETFQAIVAQDPELLYRLLHNLAERLRNAEEQMYSLALEDGPGRLARCLSVLFHRHGEPTPEGLALTLDLTREELGKLAGLSREATSRILQRFQKEGIIRMVNRRIMARRPFPFVTYGGELTPFGAKVASG